MIKKLIIVVAAVFGILINATAQQPPYKMQPVSLQTRWAKKVDPSRPLPEYPRPQLVRSRWQNLNGLWDYAITNADAGTPSQYEGKILVPYPVESALSGVKKALDPLQRLWYRHTIAKPAAKEGERILLHFGAVDWQATVFINDVQVGEHKGGYQAFSFDVTDILKTGNNELVVKVYDPTDAGINPHGKQTLRPEHIMYTPTSGIWQTVWLETVPAVYISSIKITPDVDKSILYLQANVTGDMAGYSIQAIVKNKTAIVTTTKGNANTILDLPVPNTRLWSPDDPFLYDLEIKLIKNGKLIDAVGSYFGMRKIEIKKDSKGVERIFLNNKYTYNLGTLDQGFWPEGLYTAPTDEALAFDILASKAMGFNTIRKHIKLEPARWYYHCDRIGMLVWQDMVNPSNDGTAAQSQFEAENIENMQQLYNYPCITTWILFNEGWGAYDQARLTTLMKETDPSRIINGHSGENYYKASPADTLKKWANSDMADIHAYPPPSMPPYLPGKAMVIGEFGGIGVSITSHIWEEKSGWGYGNTVNPVTMLKQYTEMMNALKTMEANGLSGSIYTQPFDVETEQNGLITYDREISKASMQKIREANALVWRITANYATATKSLAVSTAETFTKGYGEKLAEYKKGKKGDEFLYSLSIMAEAEKDEENISLISRDYIKQMKDPFTKKNLDYIKRFTQNTSSPGFIILFNNRSKVNAVLGEQEAELKLMHLIEKDWVKPHESRASDMRVWDTVDADVKKKYGDLGLETSWQLQMFHSVNRRKWAHLGKIFAPWYDRFGQYRKSISPGLANNLCYSIFEHCKDSGILITAIRMMEQSLKQDSSANAIDTYANLLYKTGRVKEAIEWEQKAVDKEPYNNDFTGTLRRMQKGRKTWKEE